MQFFVRLFLAAVFIVLFFIAVPAFLAVLGLALSGPLLTLLKVAVAAIALVYIVRGPAVPLPW